MNTTLPELFDRAKNIIMDTSLDKYVMNMLELTQDQVEQANIGGKKWVEVIVHMAGGLTDTQRERVIEDAQNFHTLMSARMVHEARGSVSIGAVQFIYGSCQLQFIVVLGHYQCRALVMAKNHYELELA